MADIQPGEGVIIPSYTLVSAADAYALRRAKIVFVGIRPDTMNIDETLIEEAEIIGEMGTNQSKFFRDQIDKYTWVNVGSSYLPSELNVAYLYAELEVAEEINQNRRASWNGYYQMLKLLEEQGWIELPYILLYPTLAGIEFGRFLGEDRFATKESERLPGLPMLYGLNESDQDKVIEEIKDFY